MKFWESQFGKKIYNLEYEKLVNNFENEVRNLVNFGLPWDSKCLHPHKNTKPVTTASKMQVRKKYTPKLRKWKITNLYRRCIRRSLVESAFLIWKIDERS